MELKELKCKNCGANLKVEQDAKDVTCNFCHTTFSVETMEKSGYEFEKGRIKAQKEEMSNNLNAAKDALNRTFSDIKINEEDVTKAAKGFGIVFGIVALSIFLVAILSFVFIFSNFNKASHKGFEDNTKSIQEEAKVNEFNGEFEIHKGTEPIVFVKDALETAVIANKKGDHIVKVVYNETNTSNPDEIINLKNSLTNNTYGISYDYGKDGYINKLILMDV